LRMAGSIRVVSFIVLAPLVALIIFDGERERITDTARGPPAKLITVVVLSHMMLMFQWQRPLVIGPAPSNGFVVLV